MRPPGALDRQAVHFLRTRPAFRRAQDEHRPLRTLGHAVLASCPLDFRDLVERLVESCRERLVHPHRLVTRHDDRPPAVALEQRDQLAFRDPGEHRRVRDLVAVELEHGQHRAVAERVQELVPVPARRQRPCLGLAVADDAGNHQVRIVERGAERVRERVAELAAFVDRPRRLGSDVARDPAGEGELPEELAQAVLVQRHVRVALRVGALEVRVGHEAWPAVSRAGDVDGVQVARTDRAVQMGIDQVEPRRRPEVAEQPRLDVLGPKRLA